MSAENKKKETKHADDSDITIYDKTGGGYSKQKSKKFLAFYIIGLFSVALVLIMLSYLTQVRANKQVNALGYQLSEQKTAATGAKEKAEQLQNMVDEQKQQFEETKKKLEQLQAAQSTLQAQYSSQSDELQKREKVAGALDMLWQLEKNYRMKKYAAARDLIVVFEEYYDGALTGKSLEEYTRIKNALEL